ncbi:CHAT domain-containing protein [Ensifer adhaerens]|uniref:CHAT domain-containing protein n=1 Tax=Ensifer adhaerens TaxID=106592 RepID=UPI000DC20DF3|nr:CHAT domain-containing protein [Ensifer adhaerens]RAS04889.1 CHAT domain-containing protein [Ensifer adhaerens]
MSEPSNRGTHYRAGIVSLPDESWNYLVEGLNREFYGALLSLRVEFSAGRVKLEAEVASEKAKDCLLGLARRHPEVEHVDDFVVVKAPFRSASRDPMDAAFENWGADPAPIPEVERITLERYPHVSLTGELTVGSDVVIAVYLEEEADEFTEGDPSVIPNVPANWQTLSVDVVVDSGQLIFDEDAKTAQVKLRNGRRSSPALIAAQVDERALEIGAVELAVQFIFERKRCGIAKRTFPLVQLEKTKPQTFEGPSRGGNLAGRPNFSTPALIQSSQDASDFIVTIHRHGSDASGTYGWQTYSHHSATGRRQTFGQINLTSSAQVFAEDLLKVCPTLEPGDHKRTLRSIGQTIWKRTPPEFKAHYRSLVQEVGSSFPIQFFSDEPYVPWEMMWPDDEAGGGDHLFISHPVARWPSSTAHTAAQSFPDGMVASFVPEYGNRALPCAQEEWCWLRDNLGAIAQDPTRQALLNFLESPPEERVRLIHFAGHGSGARPSARIELSEGRYVAVNEVDQDGVVLGRRDRSFFVLNACEIAMETMELGITSGWATALAGNGFGGVLAPIWAVKDEHASKLVTGALDLFLRNGDTIAEAVRKSRSQTRENSSTPYAYVLYGDVMARA